jgi:hypothetical protein
MITEKFGNKIVALGAVGCFGLFLAMMTSPLAVSAAADEDLEVTRIELAQIVEPTNPSPEWRGAAARAVARGATKAWGWAKKWGAVAEQVARSSGLDPVREAAGNGGVLGYSTVAMNTLPPNALD